jgi:glycine/D-amino acid oxidase-like deaminating enzyme
MGSAASAPRGPPNISFRCEALIVGAGITGVLVVVRLTRQGLDVVLIDRESPGQGSTAASTAMLLWEIDRSLTELAELYGLERAERCVRASFAAVKRIASLDRAARPSLPDAAKTIAVARERRHGKVSAGRDGVAASGGLAGKFS